MTSFEYRLHRLGPIVLGGILLWEREVLPEALHLYREIIDSAPEEFGSAFAFLSAPPEPFLPERLHGRPVVGAIVCHTGEQSAGEEILRPLRELGPPVVDLVRAMPYTVVQTLLDAGNRPGLQNYWKAEALDELTDEAIEVLADHTATVPSPISLLVLEPGGRAIARVGEDETPISRRDAYRYYAFSMWEDPGEAESHIGWARELAQAMQPFTAEGIQFNFMSDVGDERVRSTFGPKKYERLVALKEKYDPDNVFRINQNIKPSVGRVESASAEE